MQVLQGMVFSLLQAGHGFPTALCGSTPRLSRDQRHVASGHGMNPRHEQPRGRAQVLYASVRPYACTIRTHIRSAHQPGPGGAGFSDKEGVSSCPTRTLRASTICLPTATTPVVASTVAPPMTANDPTVPAMNCSAPFAMPETLAVPCSARPVRLCGLRCGYGGGGVGSTRTLLRCPPSPHTRLAAKGPCLRTTASRAHARRGSRQAEAFGCVRCGETRPPVGGGHCSLVTLLPWRWSVDDECR